MRSILRLVAGVVLAFGLSANALAAQPDGQSPETALPLSGTVSGNVTGSTGGTFVYYTFNYPGDESVGTLTLTFSPGDQATANGIGVTLWQAGSKLVTLGGLSSAFGTNSLTFSSKTAGPILAQVFNYNPGVSVAYQLTLAGVDQSAAPVPTPAPTATVGPAPSAPADGSPARPFPLTSPHADVLPGSPTGNFVYFTLDYPGDGSQQSVTLDFSPGSADVANAVFVTVYQNGTKLAAGQGTQTPTPGHLVVNFSSQTAGPVLVELANYNMMFTINYTMSR